MDEIFGCFEDACYVEGVIDFQGLGILQLVCWTSTVRCTVSRQELYFDFRKVILLVIKYCEY